MPSGINGQNIQSIRNHYDTDSGYGSIYKAWANWPTFVKSIFLGWENVIEHPAQLHYGLNFKGGNLEESINKASMCAFSDLNLNKGDQVLDAGCGLGGTSLFLAKNYPGINFIGVTLSQEQVETAKVRALKKGVVNVSYLQENFFNMSLGNSSIDGVIAMETFDSVPVSKQRQLFRELNRVLKSKGRVVVFDGFISEDLTNKEFILKHGRFIAGWTVSGQVGTASEFVKNARAEGFRVIKDIDITDQIMGCSKEIKNRAMLIYWYLKVINPLVRKKVELPLWKKMGFHHPGALAFAQSCIDQFKIFNSREGVYKEIVFEKK